MTKRNEHPLDRFKRKFLERETGIHSCTLGRIIRGERKVTKTEQFALVAVTGLKPEVLNLVVEHEDQEAS